MNLFFRRIAVFLMAASLAPALLASTIRVVDFESPPPAPDLYLYNWSPYTAYEATFDYGVRRLPLYGLTSTTFWGGPGRCLNCDYGPIRILFSKPVKNIHFTLFNLFGYYAGPIHWDSREIFTGPPASAMNINPLMVSQESRTITIPGEHVRYVDIDTNHGVALDDFTFEVEDDAQSAPTYRVELALTTDPSERPVVAQTITPGTAINAQLALGSIFTVGISKRTPDPAGGPATITAIASTYTKSADKVIPALETKTNLFTAGPVLQIDADPTTAVPELRYAAVHLGTVTFSLVPFAMGAPSP